MKRGRERGLDIPDELAYTAEEDEDAEEHVRRHDTARVYAVAADEEDTCLLLATSCTRMVRAGRGWIK